ncbi:MAG: amidophosphoribosyltransferase [Thermoproteota archaeon]
MPGEKCGIYGVKCFNGSYAFDYLYWGLLAQNHRGHESYGFLTCPKNFRRHVDTGLVPQLYGRREYAKWCNFLQGSAGIAHVRYGTSGRRSNNFDLSYAQPTVSSYKGEKIGLAFNGNIVNADDLKKSLVDVFSSREMSFDAIILSRYLVRHMSRGLIDGVERCMSDAEGAFSVVCLRSNGEVFAFRDPLGIRPLSLGESEDGLVRAFSSETIGLDINRLKYIGDVEPGEMVVLRKNYVDRERIVNPERRAFCAFEFAYFARPDSRIGGKYVYRVREEFGRNLGKRFRDVVEKADIILSVPETAEDAAYGLHEETGLKWERVMRRHRYVTHRAFIMEPDERVSTVEKKVNVMDGGLKGKRIIVIDDSIVRGDTTRTIVRRLRTAGAEKIYLFITFPRITHPCFYGVDMATFHELMGFRFTEEEIAREVGADGVFYQPIDDYVRATGISMRDLCMACVTGEYPTEMAQKMADAAKATASLSDERRIYERPELLGG